MKKALIYGLSLALVFALSACADNQGATISQEQKEPINNEETVADPLSDTEKAPATDEQEPYIVSLDDLSEELVGAFEYGYSTVHSEKPDLDEAERLEMELDLIRQWCDSFVIAIPDNLNEVYPEWHAQYEAALNAIDEGGSTGSTTGTNSGLIAAVVILGIPLNLAPVLPTIAAGLLPEAVLVVQTILMNLHPRVMQI